MKYRLLTVIIGIFFLLNANSQDNLPDAPEFLSARVVPESSPTVVRLDWNASDSINVLGYIVYKVEEVTEYLDTVVGRYNTDYNYTMSKADQYSEIFRLASYDSKGNRSALTDPHHTIFLDYEIDKCNHSIDLEWSHYVGWGDALLEYRILRREEGGVYELISAVNANVNTFTDYTVTLHKKYYYYILAINNKGITTTSNSVDVTVEGYAPPAFLYGQSLNVLDNNIDLRFIVDNSAEVSLYRIQRSTDPEDYYQTILEVENTGQKEILYHDVDLDVDSIRYYYKILSVDPCGIVSSESNYISNIILYPEYGHELFHTFTWKAFENWMNGAKEYEIYSNFDFEESKLGLTGPQNLVFTNTVGQYVIDRHEAREHITNRFCYFIIAKEDHAGNPTGVQGVSQSNELCFYIEPMIWVPNAINVSSISDVNRSFKPIVSFIEQAPYEMIIMDRWGQQVFRTTDSFESWEGVLQYMSAPPQKYLYIIRYYDYEGVEHTKFGSFMLFNE